MFEIQPSARYAAMAENAEIEEVSKEHEEKVSKEYRENIKWLAKNRIDEVFYNSNEDHAVVILSELIKNSERYVHIVCENMNPRVTSKLDYLNAVQEFLSNDKHREIKILLTDYDKSFDKSKIADLLRRYKDQVSIKCFEPEEKIFNEDDSPVNWTVADNRAFRLEENTDECMAFGNFNDPYLAGNLNESFDFFFKDSKEVKL